MFYNAGMFDVITTDLHATFCRNLRIFRKTKGLTQAQLAQRLGIATPQLTQIENGRNSPTLDTVERIANALDITPVLLLDARIPEDIGLSKAL